jgi:hypothetical protein
VGKQRVAITGFVSDHIGEILVGVDWLKTHNAVWNFGKAEVELDSHVYRLLSNDPAGCRRVTIQQNTNGPVKFETLAPTKVLQNDPNVPNYGQYQCWVAERNEPKPGLHVPRILVHDKCSEDPVYPLNAMSRPVEPSICLSSTTPSWFEVRAARKEVKRQSWFIPTPQPKQPTRFLTMNAEGCYFDSTGARVPIAPPVPASSNRNKHR